MTLSGIQYVVLLLSTAAVAALYCSSGLLGIISAAATAADDVAFGPAAIASSLLSSWQLNCQILLQFLSSEKDSCEKDPTWI